MFIPAWREKKKTGVKTTSFPTCDDSEADGGEEAMTERTIKVFEGSAAGIDSTATGFHGSFRPPEYLTVLQRDEAAARAVIADFEQHGQRGTPGWPR